MAEPKIKGKEGGVAHGIDCSKYGWVAKGSIDYNNNGLALASPDSSALRHLRAAFLAIGCVKPTPFPLLPGTLERSQARNGVRCKSRSKSRPNHRWAGPLHCTLEPGHD
jgi:hypothetical protein